MCYLGIAIAAVGFLTVIINRIPSHDLVPYHYREIKRKKRRGQLSNFSRFQVEFPAKLRRKEARMIGVRAVGGVSSATKKINWGAAFAVA